MFSGGLPGPTWETVEILAPDLDNFQCFLPDIPHEDQRSKHTASGLLLCGGNFIPATSCISLIEATWKTTNNLLHKRIRHSSWTLEDGVILFGGKEGELTLTTEMVYFDGNTTQELFNLKHRVR